MTVVHRHSKSHSARRYADQRTPPSSPKKRMVTAPPQDTDEVFPLFKVEYISAATVVSLGALACFINSFDAEFVFDDSEAVLNNKDVRSTSSFIDVFYHDFWGSNISANTSHKSYRPLTVLTFKLNYILAGGYYPLGFHLLNVIIHSVVCVLMLRVFALLFGHTTISSDHWTSAPRMSLFCAILFAVHPIHSESVAGVVGRADLLCALFICTSFILYAKSCIDDFSGNFQQDGCCDAKFPLLVLSMLFCAVAVLCKEQGITVLGLCSAYDIIVFNKIDVLEMYRQFLNKESTDETLNNNKYVPSVKQKQAYDNPRLRSFLQRHAFLFVTGICILLLRWRVMGSSPPVFQVVDNPHSFVNGTVLRFMNYNYIYALNAWILFVPWWLCFDWSMGCVPTIDSLSDPRVFVVICFWLVGALIVYWSLTVEPMEDRRALCMGVAMLVVPFLPATNVFFRVGFVIAERVLYVSCAGYCVLLALAANRLVRRYPAYHRVVGVVLIAILAVFATRSVHRSHEWRRDTLLFESGSRVCPLNAKVHYNIAKISADRGMVDYAIAKYRLAIQLHPDYDQAMNNLGNVLKDRGQLYEAERLLERAVAIRPEFAAAWMNLGIVKASLKKNASAETSYLMALEHRKRYPDCYYNLGNLYLDLGRHQEALIAWRNATLQKPTHISAWSNMIILLDNLGRLNELGIVAQEALRFLPREPTLYYNIGNAYGKAARYADSERYLLQAVQYAPRQAPYHANLGVLYHRWGRLQQAARAYEQALQLDPGSRQTRDNLDMLRRKMASN